MKNYKAISSVILLLSSLGLGAGCNGGESDSEAISALVTPAEGGRIEIEGSETGVTFPEGAVDSEVEVTLELAALSEFAEREDAVDEVYVFAPSMLLSTPANLTIELDPEFDFSKSVHLEQFVDGQWIRPDASTLEIGSGGIAFGSLLRLAPTIVVAETIVPN